MSGGQGDGAAAAADAAANLVGAVEITFEVPGTVGAGGKEAREVRCVGVPGKSF